VRKILYTVLSIVVLSAAVSVSHGRVFLRRRPGSRGSAGLASVGGHLAYESSVTLNGGDGRLSVFSFDSALPQVVRGLASLFPGQGFSPTSAGMWRGTARQGQMVLNFVAVHLERDGKTVVFSFEQSTEEERASLADPERHFLKSVPEYPGSSPVFFAKDRGTEAALAVAETGSSPSDVQDFFSSSLSAAGWSFPLPRPSSRGESLSVYLKGHNVCLVFAEPSGTNGRTTITLLHKRLGL